MLRLVHRIVIVEELANDFELVCIDELDVLINFVKQESLLLLFSGQGYLRHHFEVLVPCQRELR